MRSNVYWLLALVWIFPKPTVATAADSPRKLLCVPEKMWTCDGAGDCRKDGRPETLAAYRVDLKKKIYSRCRRDGTECGDDESIMITHSSWGYVVFSSLDLHVDTFRIDLSLPSKPVNKFLVHRISGGFFDFPRNRADLKTISQVSTSGSCVVLE